MATGVCAALVSGCAAPANAPLGGAPIPEARVARLVTALETRSAPGAPVRLTFDWRAREPGSRWEGFGVARIEPPHRARLDLFLENGETAAIAALVGHDPRIPPGLPATLLPPPPLLWAALGVFHPGSAARLAAATRDGDAHRFGYELETGVELRFAIDPGPDGAPGPLRRAALLRGGATVEDVALLPPPAGGIYPARATYRNLAEYRELVLTLEMVEDADPFPPEIWIPYRAR